MSSNPVWTILGDPVSKTKGPEFFEVRRKKRKRVTQQ